MIDLYEYPTGEEQIFKQGQDPMICERIEYEGGIKIYVQGHKYPYKGGPTAHALFVISQIKSVFLNTIRVFGLRVLTVSPQKLIKGFNEVCFKIIRQVILKDKYRMKFTSEFYKFLYTFLVEYGINKEEADMFSITIAHIFEYDNAYRMRLQDLFSSTTKERLYTRKEIKRLTQLNADRDYKGKESIFNVSLKFKYVARLISYALLIPSIRKAYRKALDQMNIENLQLDKDDIYWILHRADYNYLNLPFEERKKLIETYE